MEHEKVYAVCENKCFVETMTKEQIEEWADEQIKEQIEEYDTNLQSKTFMSAVPCRLNTPNVGGKKRYRIFINQAPKNIMLPDGFGCWIKISWFTITAGNVTNNSKLCSLPEGQVAGKDYDTNINLAIGQYYVEIENLSYTEPAEE